VIETYQNPTRENANDPIGAWMGLLFRAVPRITLLGIVARRSREITERSGERQGSGLCHRRCRIPTRHLVRVLQQMLRNGYPDPGTLGPWGHKHGPLDIESPASFSGLNHPLSSERKKKARLDAPDIDIGQLNLPKQHFNSKGHGRFSP
jgi:hypothetical protein